MAQKCFVWLAVWSPWCSEKIWYGGQLSDLVNKIILLENENCLLKHFHHRIMVFIINDIFLKISLVVLTKKCLGDKSFLSYIYYCIILACLLWVSYAWCFFVFLFVYLLVVFLCVFRLPQKIIKKYKVCYAWRDRPLTVKI